MNNHADRWEREAAERAAIRRQIDDFVASIMDEVADRLKTTDVETRTAAVDTLVDELGAHYGVGAG